MGTLATTCPACKTEKIALETFRSKQASVRMFTAYVWWQCPRPNCEQAGAALVEEIDVIQTFKPDHIAQRHIEFGEKYKLLAMWPRYDQGETPKHLPDRVMKALKQAEYNFQKPEMAEPSGIMYRRALELAIKTIDEDGKGDLVTRIRQAAKKGILTKDIADWAHNIRILGNDATHEMDGIDQDELKALRGLTKSVLQYVFTLPTEVKILKDKTALPENNEPAIPASSD